MFLVFWNNEEIDSFSTRGEAEKMAREYSIAFGGGVSIRERQ